MSGNSVGDPNFKVQDKETQRVWWCGQWAQAGGAGLRQVGRNQSDLGATGRSAQSRHDLGLATKSHRMGRGVRPVRQDSASQASCSG